jgi:hypothetical protein
LKHVHGGPAAISAGAGWGWRLSGCSKTQYASLHGWEHFQRCHCAVVNLLADAGIPVLRVPARQAYSPAQIREQVQGLIRSPARVFSKPAGI